MDRRAARAHRCRPLLDHHRVTDDARLRRLADLWTSKWDGRWHFEVRDASFVLPGGEHPSLVYRVEPAKVLAFGQGTFTHTRHRF